MAEPSRYSLSNEEVAHKDGVLANKLGIRDQVQLDDAETVLFSDTFTHFFDLFSRNKLNYNLALLFQIHEYFLATLYPWAGKLRSVDMSKGGMHFASAAHLSASLQEFESLLKTRVPREGETKKQAASSLALLHCDLNAIHPFREGNGRTIRLFLDLLAARAGYAPIDWSKRSQRYYIQACIDGMSKKYARMEKIIYAGLVKQK